MPRFSVCIFGRIAPDADLGTIDVTQEFASRIRAERFAMAISRHLPPGPAKNGCTQAWVLVYAHAIREFDQPHCYLSVDPGGVVVKHHDIRPGCWGHRPGRSLIKAHATCEAR